MFRSKSYKRHYFSIESLLATEEQLACKFLKDDNYIGFLEPNSKTNKITAGSFLQLPFWIAANFIEFSSIVEVELPQQYRKVFRDILNADPSVVNLRRLSRFYYILGENLSKLKHVEYNDIKAVLIQTLRGRFRMIMDWALNGDTNQVKKLDSSEMNIFEHSKKSQDMLDIWLKDGSSVIEASSMIISHKKRKTANDQIL